jgi:hypothetical protein
MSMRASTGIAGVFVGTTLRQRRFMGKELS